MLEKPDARVMKAARTRRHLNLDTDLCSVADDRIYRSVIRAVLAALFGVLIWAWFTPIHETISGTGLILPADGARPAQHLDGGLVLRVLKKEGDFVSKGSSILQLDMTQAKLSLEQLQARREALTAKIERWRAVAEGKDFQPPATASGREELAVFLAEARTDTAVLDVIDREATVARRQVDIHQVRLDALREEIELLREIETRQQTLLARGSVSIASVNEARRQRLRAEQNEAEYQSQLAHALLDVTRAALARNRHITDRQADARTRIAAASPELAELLKQIQSQKIRLSRDRVVSPVAGQIQELKLVDPGQIVEPGVSIATIIPVDRELFAELWVSADEIASIVPGQTASVKIQTYDFARFGALKGEVLSVSPTSEPDASGRPAYRVRVQILDAGNATIDLRPGLTVSADMRTGSKTVLEYFLKPLRVLRDRALTEA